MNKRTSLFLTAPIFAVSLSANAGNYGTGPITINKLEQWHDGHLYLHTTPPPNASLSTCIHKDKYILPSTRPDMMRSMLLAARAAGEQVSLVIVGGQCINDRQTIVSIVY